MSNDPEQEMLKKIPQRRLEEVIEEVDEQLTMMSMRDEPPKPSVRDIFSHVSKPIDIPSPVRYLDSDKWIKKWLCVYRTDNDDPLSFEALRQRREEDRLRRIKTNLTRYLESKDAPPSPHGSVSGDKS